MWFRSCPSSSSVRSFCFSSLTFFALLQIFVHFAYGLYSSSSDVVQLTDQNFAEEVIQSDGVSIVEFYAPWCGHCKSLVPEYNKAASMLKGIVKVGAVDATVSEKLANKYKIQGFPTIKIFAGSNKKKGEDYEGGRSAQAIVDAGTKAIKKVLKERQSDSGGSRGSKSKSKGSGNSDGGGGNEKKGKGGKGKGKGKGNGVVTLNAFDFGETVYEKHNELWMVAFVAPWCGHCQRLKPEWENAAIKLKDHNVNLAVVDATEDINKALANDFGVRGFPTIKYFPPSSKVRTAKSAKEYNGPREEEGIIDYGMTMAEKYDLFKIPPPTELVSNKVLAETCSGATVCLLAALPPLLDGGKAQRDKYLATLEEASLSMKRLPVKLLWYSGNDFRTEDYPYQTMESMLGVESGYPALTALRLDKKVYVSFRGSFTVEKISSFVSSLMGGSGAKTLSFVPISDPTGLKAALPKKGVIPWDGKDVEDDEIIYEEEFSLEDIMGEL